MDVNPSARLRSFELLVETVREPGIPGPARCSTVGSALSFFLGMPSSVAVTTGPFGVSAVTVLAVGIRREPG
jgi:hypothetical protein